MSDIEETNFNRKIDCLLSYGDINACKSLMDEAVSISDNAMFTVLHEICRAPSSKNVLPTTQLKLADIWLEKATHQKSFDIYTLAKKMIDGENISVEQSIQILDKVSEFPELSSALQIVYFSCDDVDGKMEYHYEKIVKSWQRSA